jgi:dihydropyrimidine dehydrogenase (NADP+)
VAQACSPLAFTPSGTADVDILTMQAKAEPWLFAGTYPASDLFSCRLLTMIAGGDLAGNGTTVEAANDGKQASWHIHKYLQSLHKLTVPDTPQLPLFCTPVDLVGIFPFLRLFFQVIPEDKIFP